MQGIERMGEFPRLIQGGMGIAISNWTLARAVASRGHLGVVSGTALERVVASRLQEGDQEGTLALARDAFPNQELAARVYERWHRAGGLSSPGSYKTLTPFSESPPVHLVELTIFAAFAEVFLAKRGVAGPVGINLLEKIQPPTLPTLYGAMLAGVDYVLMGAGIPREIPGHLDRLARHESCALRLMVDERPDELLPFVPADHGCAGVPLRRPRFLAIVSSHVLAMSLARSGGVDGFIVESHVAGGHNAGPRGWSVQSGNEPHYGDRDVADLGKIRALDLPFWLAGGQDTPEAMRGALELGAQGLQIGSAFAFCRESGMEPGLRRRAIEAITREGLEVRTEGRGSPTGFPFKVLPLSGTDGGRPADERVRHVCAHGYLREAYRKPDGAIGWRCPAEPVQDYVRKGGALEDCADRRCLCRGLMATAGHPELAVNGGLELPLITAGTARSLDVYLSGGLDYSANAVIDHLLP